MIEAATFLIFPLCLSIAALSDLFTMTIPNRVSLILIASFLVIALLSGVPLQLIGMHFAGAAIVFAVCFALFAVNVMGGGDAKLLTAAALWFGYDPSLLIFLIYVAYIGGLVTIAIVLLRSQRQTINTMGLRIPDSLLIAKKIPYGIAIGIAGFLAYPSSPLMEAALARLH
ncbi:peptidase [Neorhizobium sp. P12A]|uniref:A24 family peptidase n=1 Tax=Neorhizobium sp. P12A TaxID=2268027 RepID=UPI0011EBA49B|nr:prepilin peptidase [Neorhizobium sp. P12A]KAA0700007.1 peptidase [Neorhizobium sp. P12A]